MVHGTVRGCEIITSDIPLTRVNHLMWTQAALLLTFLALNLYVQLATLTDDIVFNFGGSAYVFGALLVALTVLQGVSFPIWKRQVTRNEPDPTNPGQPLDLVGKPMLLEISIAVWISTMTVVFVVAVFLTYVLRESVFPWAFTLPTEIPVSEVLYISQLDRLYNATFFGVVVLVRVVCVHWAPIATVTSLKKSI